MSRTGFRVASQRIEAEKCTKHVGVARIRLDILDFPNSRSLNPKNVQRLKNLFHDQRGCQPGDLQNRIPAVIDDAMLSEALALSGLAREALYSSEPEYPRLTFPPGVRLECLRGQHRVQAAKETFQSIDTYWVIDLFIADISHDAKRELAEEYGSEKRPDDGEFYYKIRQYQGVFGQGNPYFEKRWWARLTAISTTGSTNPKDRLQQLLRHQKFASAFDAFRYIPALYCGLRLSAVNKMTAMKCDEELLSYLSHIRNFWYALFDGNEDDMQKLDVESVRALQLKAPGACDGEARGLYGRVCAGEILSAFSDQQRQMIWSRVCSASVDCLIPSLSGFFDDLKHWKLIADSVKWLLRLGKGETIRSALQRSFSYADEGSKVCYVQDSNSTLRSISGSEIDQFDVAYRMLWLCALRGYREMPAKTKKKLAGTRSGEVNPKTLFEFASLANSLGFRSAQIQTLLQRDPDREIARRLLLTARAPSHFEYQDLERVVTEVTELMKLAQPVSNEGISEGDLDRLVGSPVRSGIPILSDQAWDKPYMFLDKLHTPVTCGVTLTSFFIQRSTYFAFFRKHISINLDHTRNDSHPPRQIVEPTIAIGQQFCHERPEYMVVDNATQQDHLENLRYTIQEKKTTLMKISAEEQEAERKLQRLNSQTVQWQDELKQLEAVEREKSAAVEGLKAEESRLCAQMAELVAEITRLSTERDQQAQQQAQQQDRLQQLKVVERENSAAVEELKAEESRLCAQIAELVAEITRLSTERDEQAQQGTSNGTNVTHVVSKGRKREWIGHNRGAKRHCR